VKSFTERPECPHCNTPLQAFKLPDNTGWQDEIHFACFNDDCPYYRRGWEHMTETYSMKVSYRYRVIPETGKSSPLPVWSPEAMRDRILDAEITAERVPEDHPSSEEGNES
jgi:hypothetical protein